jgi:hypothetical protein
MKVYRFTKYNLSISDTKIHIWKFAMGPKAQNFNFTVNSLQNVSSGHVAVSHSDGTEGSDFTDQTGRKDFTYFLQLQTQ